MRQKRDWNQRLGNVHASGVDWKTRTVWIVDELPALKSFQYLPAIKLLDESNGKINVIIASCGGEESGGFALFDLLRSLKNEVITVGIGEVSSIASLIFQAGGRRYLTKNCQLMMHNGRLTLNGVDVDSDTIKKLAIEATRNDHRYHKAIAEVCKVDLTKIEKWCTEERYFSAEEAVAEGLADGVVESWRNLK